MLDRAHHVLVLALVLAALTLVAGASAGCSRTSGQGMETSGGVAAQGASSMASGSGASAMAAPDASPVAADTTTGTSPTAGADATAPMASAADTATAMAGDGAAPACGTKPLPDCPLQGWMKANTSPAVSKNDLPALAIALDKIAAFAPAGYTNWATISKDGAKAAKAGDMTAAKASCRTCHDQYKDKYRKELRARKI